MTYQYFLFYRATLSCIFYVYIKITFAIGLRITVGEKRISRFLKKYVLLSRQYISGDGDARELYFILLDRSWPRKSYRGEKIKKYLTHFDPHQCCQL
jgi:hypothetical protein